jgi:hypothetical protein
VLRIKGGRYAQVAVQLHYDLGIKVNALMDEDTGKAQGFMNNEGREQQNYTENRPIGWREMTVRVIK